MDNKKHSVQPPALSLKPAKISLFPVIKLNGEKAKDGLSERLRRLTKSAGS